MSSGRFFLLFHRVDSPLVLLKVPLVCRKEKRAKSEARCSAMSRERERSALCLMDANEEKKERNELFKCIRSSSVSQRMDGSDRHRLEGEFLHFWI